MGRVGSHTGLALSANAHGGRLVAELSRSVAELSRSIRTSCVSKDIPPPRKDIVVSDRFNDPNNWTDTAKEQ